MDKRYQVFISSTYNDLIEERQKVTQAILKLYHFPIGMEMFHADNAEQWEQIKNTIDMSDYYILIMGRYCGTLIEEENISYTEKEYNYALKKGIPILSFVISNDAKKESYGIESAKQQRAYKKFHKKVLQLPCDFWRTPDELALLVTSTLSLKFRENNRDGWIPYNSSDIISSKKIDAHLVGEYDVFYYSVFKSKTKRLIHSQLLIEASGKVTLYNNINANSVCPEYTYHGICIADENILYIYLKNDYSNERATMTLMRPVGNLERVFGIFSGLSSNLVPVSIKVACFKNNLNNNGINFDLLKKILNAQNTDWDDSVMIIEERQKYLFFSEEIIDTQ